MTEKRGSRGSPGISDVVRPSRLSKRRMRYCSNRPVRLHGSHWTKSQAAATIGKLRI